jgi:hypothetical protein
VRHIFAFILGLALTIAAVQPLAMPSKGNRYNHGGFLGPAVLPEPAETVFNDALRVWGISIYVGIMMLSITIIALPFSTKAWPLRSTVAGIAAGFSVAAVLDGTCIRALRQANLPPDHNPPGYVLCIVLWAAAVAGLAILLWRWVEAIRYARLPTCNPLEPAGDSSHRHARHSNCKEDI